MDQLIDQAVALAVPGVFYVGHLIGAYVYEHLPEVQPHDHAVNGTIQPPKSLLPVEATMVTETEICTITKFIELTEFETETQTIDKCGPTVFTKLPEVKFVDSQTTSTRMVVDASQKVLSTAPVDWESWMWWILQILAAVLMVALLVWTFWEDPHANDDPPAPPPGEDGGGNDGGGGGDDGNDGDDGKNDDGQPPEDEQPDSDDDSSSGDDDTVPSANNNDAGPAEDDNEVGPAEDVDAESPGTDRAVPPEDDNAGLPQSDDTRSPEHDDHAGAPEGDNAGAAGDGDGAGALPEDDDHATSPVDNNAGAATGDDAGLSEDGGDGATDESSTTGAQDSQSTNNQSIPSSRISLKPFTQWLPGLRTSAATDSDLQDQLAKLRNELKASEEKRAQTMAELRTSNEKRTGTMVGFEEALESRKRAEESKKAAEEKLAKVEEQLSRQNNATAGSTITGPTAAVLEAAVGRRDAEMARLQARVAELEANPQPTEGDRAASLNTGTQTREHDQCPYSREEIREVTRDQERLRTRLVECIPYLEQALKDVTAAREKAKDAAPGFAGNREGRPDVERTREDCDRAKTSLQKSRDVYSKLSLWHPGPLEMQSRESDHTNDEVQADDREDEPCTEVRADLRAAHAKIGRLQTLLLELEVENAALKSHGSTTRQPPVPSSREISDLNHARFSEDKDPRWFATENATLRAANRSLRAAQNDADPSGSALDVQAADRLAMQDGIIADSTMRLVRQLGRAEERIKELESMNQALSNNASPPRNLQADKDDDPCKEVKDELETEKKKNITLQEEIERLNKLLAEAELSIAQAWASNSPSGKSKKASGNNEDPCKEVKDKLQASQKKNITLQEEIERQKKLLAEAELSVAQAWASNSPSGKSKETGSGNNKDPCKKVKEELQAAQKKIVTLEAEIQRLEKLLTKPDQLTKDGSASKSKEGAPGPDGDADPCKEWKDALEESRQDFKRMEKLKNVEKRLREAAQKSLHQHYPEDVWDTLRTEHKLDVNQTLAENRELEGEIKKLKHKVEHLSRGGKSSAEDEEVDDLFFSNDAYDGVFPRRKSSGFGMFPLKRTGSTKPEVKVDPCKEVKADLAIAKAEVERLTAELATAKAELAAEKSAAAKPETEQGASTDQQTQTEEDPCKEEKIKLAAAETKAESLTAQLAEAKAPKRAKTLDEEIYGRRASWDETRSRNFLQKKVDRLEKELGEQKEKSSSQETEKAAKELQEKVDSATKERDAAKEEVEKLKSQLVTAGSDLTTNQIAKGKVTADLVAAEGARKTAEEELATLRKELKTATAALQASLAADKTALTAKEAALAECKAEIVDLKEKVKTANNARLASLTADKTALTAKEAALASCEAEKVKLKKQLEDANKPAATTTPGGGVKSRTTLELELSQAVKKNSKLEKDLQSAKKLSNAKAILEENGAPARSPCQKYIDELAKEKAEVKRLKDEIARLERVIQNLQNRLEAPPDGPPDDDDGGDDPKDGKPDHGKAADSNEIAGAPQAAGAAPKPATSSRPEQPNGDKATEAGSTADRPIELDPASSEEAEKAHSPPPDVPLKQPPSALVFEPEDKEYRPDAPKRNDSSDDSADEKPGKDNSLDSEDENETPLPPKDVPEIGDLLKKFSVGGKEATKGPLSPPVAPDEQAPIPIAEDEQDTQVSKGKSDQAEVPAQIPTAVPLRTSPKDTGTSTSDGGHSSNDDWSVARDVEKLVKKMSQANEVDQRHENHAGGFRTQRPMPEGGDERVSVEKERQKSAEAVRKLQETLRKLNEEPMEVGNVSDSDYSSVTSNGESDTGEFDDDDKKGGDSDGDNDGDDPPPPTRKPMPAASKGRNASVPNSVVSSESQGQSNIPVDPRRQSLPPFDFSPKPHPPGHYQNGESSTRPSSSPQPSTMTLNTGTGAGGPGPLLGETTGLGKRGFLHLEQTKAPVLDARSDPRPSAISPAPQKFTPPVNVLTGPNSTGFLPTGQMALPTGQMALPTGQLAFPPLDVPIVPQPMEAVPTSATWFGPNAVPRLAFPTPKASAGQQASAISPAQQKPAPPSNALTGPSSTGSLPTGQMALPTGQLAFPPLDIPIAPQPMEAVPTSAPWIVPIAPEPMEAVPTSASWFGPNAVPRLALPTKTAAASQQGSVTSPAPEKPAPSSNAPTGQRPSGSLPAGQAALPPVNAPIAPPAMKPKEEPYWARWVGGKGGLALPKKPAATGPQASVLSSTPAIPAPPSNAQTAPSRAGSLPTGQVALPPLNSQDGPRSMQATAPAPSPSLGGFYGSVHAPAAGAAAEQLPDIRRAQSPVAEEERFKPRGRFAKEGGGAQAGAVGSSETGSGSGGSRTAGSANRGRNGSGSGVSGRGSKAGVIGSRKQKRPPKEEDPSKKKDP